MGAPGAEAGVAHDDPVAFLEGLNGGPDRGDGEGAFVAGYGGGLGCAEQGGKGRFGGVDALDLVDVGGVNRGGESAKED